MKKQSFRLEFIPVCKIKKCRKPSPILHFLTSSRPKITKRNEKYMNIYTHTREKLFVKDENIFFSREIKESEIFILLFFFRFSHLLAGRSSRPPRCTADRRYCHLVRANEGLSMRPIHAEEELGWNMS